MVAITCGWGFGSIIIALRPFTGGMVLATLDIGILFRLAIRRKQMSGGLWKLRNEKMKKMKEWRDSSGRLRLVFFAALALAFAGCSQPKALVYTDLRNFRVQAVNLQQMTVVLDLEFYNPNGYGLSLKNGNLDAFFNNKYLGKAVLDERMAVPAKDTFLLPVSVTADLRNILSNAFDLLTKGDKDVLVRLQGSVKAGKGGIFIGVPVKYEGRQKIHL